MKIKEMNEIVNMLNKEWDLGKKSSQSKGKSGCKKIYETQIENKEQNKCGNSDSEIGYIYEKKLS